MSSSPIFLMSFDRPEYLARVLGSLKAQTNCFLDQRPIALFQDGGVSPFSKRNNACEATIHQCIDVFRKEFPRGIVVESATNLGVALNFERAERYAFEELGASSAIFLEDDLVLGEHYISTIDTLVGQFSQDERVGYVAAYGDHTKTLEEQHANSRKLILLGHNWGFAIFKRQWQRMRSRVLEYLEAIKGCDYKDRDGEKVKNLFASWGYGDPAISQDAAKTIACCAEGIVKVNTYICNGAYIGERGVHMNEKIFAERGYSRTVLYPQRVSSFEPLGKDLYERLLREQRDWAKSSRFKATANTSPKGAATSDVMSQQLMDAIISAAYQALLRRDADASGLASYRKLFDGRPISESTRKTLVGLLDSGEFVRNWEASPARIFNRMLLSVQKALLGKVTPALRAVTCGWNEKKVVVRSIFDGAIGEDDERDLQGVQAAIAEFMLSTDIVMETVRLDYPRDRQDAALQAWAYMRKEEPLA
jgi:hypothetical protein